MCMKNLDFGYTEENLAKDVREVFESIQSELQDNYMRGANDVEHMKNALFKHAPDLVFNKNLLLLDTVLNYLTKDARKILEKEDHDVINEFYECNQEWLEKLKLKFQETLNKKDISFSADPRLVYGGTAGTVGFVVGKVMGGMLFSSVISWMVALTLATGSFIGIYHKTTPIVLDKVQQELGEYLSQAHRLALKRLNGIITDYKNSFAKFLQEKNESLR